MTIQMLLSIEDSSQVGNARRMASELSIRLGFDSTDVGKVALAATEMATNILKHATHGCMLLSTVGAGRGEGIELLALDRGPGIADIGASLRDGHSTSGSLGAGLGILSRLSPGLQIFSLPGRGTAVRLELGSRSQSPQAQEFGIGGLRVAKRGEAVCGDDWRCEIAADCLNVLLADGLGHGIDAAKAAGRAMQVLTDYPAAEPHELIDQCHVALAATRGGAVAAARLKPSAETGAFAGVGNIVARVENGKTRHLISHNGTVGHTLRKVQEFAFPWPKGSLMIMHSDGLSTHWDLKEYPGLASKHPALIAGVLYRDFERGRDDVTVVVIRNGAAR